MKRLLIVAAVLLLLAGVGLVLFARSVLTGANVRAAVESQISKALGQPVSIGGIGASAYPRVTMDLTDVTIGGPGRIHLETIHLGTGLRALFSRRVEHADVRIEGARVTLPLPALGTPGPPSTSSTNAPSASPVEIVSIDEIVLKNVEVISGTRTLKGDIELVPHHDSLQIRRISLAAEDTAVEITGSLTSLSPIAGGLDVTSESLDIDRLLGFVNDFATTPVSSAPAGNAAAAAPASSPIEKITLGLKVGRATTGSLALSAFAATAVVTPASIEFEPLTFGIFGGGYEGVMRLHLGDTPSVIWSGSARSIDAAKLMAFAGSAGTISGTLNATLRLEGRGLGMEQALRSASGTARIEITDGSIAGLQLVRTIVTATSGRGGIVASASAAAAASREASGAERFTRLGAALRLAGASITTDNLAMVSPDVDLSASGTLRLVDMRADLGGRVQLSEALSKQAGTDLYRYTQDGGRVTLPVTVSGPIAHLAVGVDLGDVAKRAIKNKASEEVNKAIQRGLGSLFKRKPS